MIGAATALMVHFLISSGGLDGMIEALRLPREIWLIAIILALFCTLLPSFFINIAIGRIGAQLVAILGMVGPARDDCRSHHCVGRTLLGSGTALVH